MNLKLNEEERKIVADILTYEKQNATSYLNAIWPYYLPIIALAVYGIWKMEYIAISIAFFTLLLLNFWYLKYHYKQSIYLSSALKKYEDVVGAVSGEITTKT